MEKEDARYQALEQLHERRNEVARLHKKDIRVMQIVAMTGLSYPTCEQSPAAVQAWLQGEYPVIEQRAEILLAKRFGR